MQEKFLRQITDFIFVENPPKRADLILIPGSGYPQIAEEAARLYKNGYAPLILPSGRYSILKGKFAGVWEKEALYGGDYETEWEFLKTVLIKNQVPPEKILREDQATYTYENAIYSRTVIDQLGMKIEKAILCCKKSTFVLSVIISGNRIFCLSCKGKQNNKRELVFVGRRNRNRFRRSRTLRKSVS